MFKKGDYIVLTAGIENDQFKHHHVFKQKKDHISLSVEKDLNGVENGWSHYGFKTKGPYTGKWRYANSYEVNLYELFNRPIHINTKESDELARTTKITIHLPRL